MAMRFTSPILAVLVATLLLATLPLPSAIGDPAAEEPTAPAGAHLEPILEQRWLGQQMPLVLHMRWQLEEGVALPSPRTYHVLISDERDRVVREGWVHSPYPAPSADRAMTWFEPMVVTWDLAATDQGPLAVGRYHIDLWLGPRSVAPALQAAAVGAFLPNGPDDPSKSTFPGEQSNSLSGGAIDDSGEAAAPSPPEGEPARSDQTTPSSPWWTAVSAVPFAIVPQEATLLVPLAGVLTPSEAAALGPTLSRLDTAPRNISVQLGRLELELRPILGTGPSATLDLPQACAALGCSIGPTGPMPLSLAMAAGVRERTLISLSERPRQGDLLVSPSAFGPRAQVPPDLYHLHAVIEATVDDRGVTVALERTVIAASTLPSALQVRPLWEDNAATIPMDPALVGVQLSNPTYSTVHLSFAGLPTYTMVLSSTEGVTPPATASQQSLGAAELRGDSWVIDLEPGATLTLAPPTLAAVLPSSLRTPLQLGLRLDGLRAITIGDDPTPLATALVFGAPLPTVQWQDPSLDPLLDAPSHLMISSAPPVEFLPQVLLHNHHAGAVPLGELDAIELQTLEGQQVRREPVDARSGPMSPTLQPLSDLGAALAPLPLVPSADEPLPPGAYRLVTRVHIDGTDFPLARSIAIGASAVPMVAVRPLGDGGGDLPHGHRVTAVPTLLGERVALTAASTIVLSALVALAATTEAGRWSLHTWIILPLYSRLRREEVLDQFLRGKIQGYVIANPGEHYNAIREALDIPNGTLAYHLRVLEREGYVKVLRDGVFKRFYPANERLPQRRNLTMAQSLIVEQIRQEPGVSQAEIGRRMGTSVQVVNYYVSRLGRMGLVEMQRQGRTTRCFLVEGRLEQAEGGGWSYEALPGIPIE